MFYATIFLCTMAQPVCDVGHAFYASQSDPVFDTDEECRNSAFAELQVVYWSAVADDAADDQIRIVERGAISVEQRIP